MDRIGSVIVGTRNAWNCTVSALPQGCNAPNSAVVLTATTKRIVITSNSTEPSVVFKLPNPQPSTEQEESKVVHVGNLFALKSIVNVFRKDYFVHRIVNVLIVKTTSQWRIVTFYKNWRRQLRMDQISIALYVRLYIFRSVSVDY